MGLKSKIFFLARGILFGVLLYIYPSVILLAAVLWGIIFFIRTRPKADRDVLFKIVGLAFFLRVMFFTISIFIVYSANFDIPCYMSKAVGHTIQLIRDFDREIKNGLQIARYLSGEFGDVPVKQISHHGFGYLHFGAWLQGILNYFFGPSVLNILIFPMLDLLSVLLVYYLGKAIFDRRIAIFSSVLYAVMPSVAFIACTNVRSSVGVSSLLLVAITFVKFSKSNSPKYLLGALIGLALFYLTKDKAATPLLALFPVLFLVTLNLKFRRRFIILVVCIVICVALFFSYESIQKSFDSGLRNIILSQAGFATLELGSSYRIYDEVAYGTQVDNLTQLQVLSNLVRGLPKGTIYFMFAPFPWDVNNTTRLYAYPQIIFWYFVVLLALIGVMISLSLRKKETLPVVVLCVYFLILFSLVIGNEGIAARYRELIAPFFYIFAGFAVCRFISPHQIEG